MAAAVSATAMRTDTYDGTWTLDPVQTLEKDVVFQGVYVQNEDKTTELTMTVTLNLQDGQTLDSYSGRWAFGFCMGTATADAYDCFIAFISTPRPEYIITEWTTGASAPTDFAY